MRLLYLLLTTFILSISLSAFSQVKKKENILIITAHPDDWEDGMGGTAYLLSKEYNIHVIIATKGERGLESQGKTFDETTPIRIKEAQNACDKIGAKLHFMGKIDQEVHADNQGIDQVVELLEELDPKIIFTMWNVEIADHAGAGAIAIQALYRTKMIYDREVYFFEASRGYQTNHFNPDIYVNITSVIDKKMELIRCHVCQNPNDDMAMHHKETNKFHGDVARSNYSEGFKTYLPLINARWDKNPTYSLLNIEEVELKHPYDNNKEVLIICAHPDDWELAMGGTALKMKDKYNIHVVILTQGEAALDLDKAEATAKLRKEQAEKACAKINATLHIMDFGDGKLVTSKAAVDSVVAQLNTIKPGIVFCHWGIDKADHAAAANICTKALNTSKMIYDMEIYYFGGALQNLSQFEPEIYVNISDVADEKRELIEMHALPNHKEGMLEGIAFEANKYFGLINRCEYAEGFRTQFPLINHRWEKKTKFSLLDL